MNRRQRTPEEAQALAERARDAMWAEDRASRGLGMQVRAVGPGSATLTMTVRDDMVNSHGICHGGFIATVADSAFAFACNAYDEMTVASGFDINLIAAAQLGDVLTASCTEVYRAGRTGVYDVQVHNQRGERIAVFRGRSYALKGRTVIPE
jgi:acyl-CoA thioesterase